MTSSSGDAGPTDEEYAVYSSILSRTHIIDGKETTLVVLGSETASPSEDELHSTAECQHNPPLQSPPPPPRPGPYLLSDELRPVVSDLFAKNRKPYSLARKFDINRDYILVSVREVQPIFDEHGPFVGWTAFYEKFRGAEGYKVVSRVGFDPEKKTALVYFMSGYAAIAQFPSFILVRKEGGKWRRVDAYTCESRAGIEADAP